MLFIIIWIALAALTMHMAHARGRNKWLGLVLGFCFGIFTVFGYLIAGDSEEKKVEQLRRAMS